MVEDHPEQREELAVYLRASFPGVDILAASDGEAAVKEYLKLAISVVVTDMRMGAEDAGFQVLLDFKREFPGTYVIVYTGVALDLRVAVLCMRSGCYDYIEKPNVGQLAASVQVALDLADPFFDRDSLRERLILADWSILQEANDSVQKGRALESLCSTLFSSIPGWSRVETRLRSKTEEFDLVIFNESKDEFWRRYRNFILVECKNWARKKLPGRSEFDSFYQKIERRGNADCRLGFFVSLKGVSRPFRAEMERIAREDTVMVLINQEQIWELIAAQDRATLLKQFVGRQVFS